MKRKDPATKNQKYLAIFLAVTMFLSAFMIFFTGDSKTDNDSDISTSETGDNNSMISFSQIPGKQVNHKFNSIADGLNMSPEGVTNAMYVDMQRAAQTPMENAFGDKEMIKSFYGADVTKRYSTNYADGSGFELHQIPEQKILIPLGAVPYDGYNLLARANSTYDVWNVAGSPVIFGPRNTVEEVIDVLEGNATNASEYDQVLSQADYEGAIFQEVGMKSNLTDLQAEQYYRDVKKLDNGSYTQTTVFLNPENEIKENITALQANSSERGVTYNVTTSGNITKLVVTSDFASLLNETQLLSL